MIPRTNTDQSQHWPEHAYAAHEARYVTLHKPCNDGQDLSIKQEEEFVEEIEKVQIGCDTADTIDSVDYNFDREENYFFNADYTNSELKSVCDAILKHLKASQYQKEVEELPKPYCPSLPSFKQHHPILQ